MFHCSVESSPLQQVKVTPLQDQAGLVRFAIQIADAHFGDLKETTIANRFRLACAEVEVELKKAVPVPKKQSWWAR